MSYRDDNDYYRGIDSEYGGEQEYRCETYRRDDSDDLKRRDDDAPKIHSARESTDNSPEALTNKDLDDALQLVADPEAYLKYLEERSRLRREAEEKASATEVPPLPAAAKQESSSSEASLRFAVTSDLQQGNSEGAATRIEQHFGIGSFRAYRTNFLDAMRLLNYDKRMDERKSELIRQILNAAGPGFTMPDKVEGAIAIARIDPTSKQGLADLDQLMRSINFEPIDLLERTLDTFRSGIQRYLSFSS